MTVADAPFPFKQGAQAQNGGFVEPLGDKLDIDGQLLGAQGIGYRESREARQVKWASCAHDMSPGHDLTVDLEFQSAVWCGGHGINWAKQHIVLLKEASER